MKSKSLSELQNLFYQSVVSPKNADQINSQILEKAPLSNKERLQIYQDAYQIRILHSLREDFSRVEEACGENVFEELILNFVTSTPSTVKNLAEHSEMFVNYIQTKQPQYLKFAKIDWAEILSDHAIQPADSLTGAEISEEVYFTVKIHPASQLIQVENENILIFRSLEQIQTKYISDPEAQLFQFLSLERTQNQIIEFIKASNSDANNLANTISEWIATQIIYCKKGSI